MAGLVLCVWEQILVVGIHQVLREVFLRSEFPPAYMAPSDRAVAPLPVYFAHPRLLSLDSTWIPRSG